MVSILSYTRTIIYGDPVSTARVQCTKILCTVPVLLVRALISVKKETTHVNVHQNRTSSPRVVYIVRVVHNMQHAGASS